ncbi:MAG: Rieske 2Fe-2S domain-containing protein [Myxococcales bacterium]|nr:Rieske 2Fe-2S domain-containing protein [Myxococcales bacterium]
MERQWIPAFRLDHIARGASKLFKHGRDRIAVFHLDDGELYAVDDRCPHEGYPLCQGAVSGQVLTCCFHNFKFDLPSGECLVGDEQVRTFGVRVVEGTVQLDVTPPDPAVEIERRLHSLRSAVSADRVGQMTRDVVRLLALGVPVRSLAQEAAAWDGAHAEYGSTHALAVAADAERLAAPGLEAARALAPAFELASRASARRAPHPEPVPADAGDPATFADRLRVLVEAEDHDGAQALLAGALTSPTLTDAVLEEAFLLLASDHFLDFGHAMIYANKVFGLLAEAPSAARSATLSGLLRSIVYGTREDTLPAWSGWRKRVTEATERFGGWRQQTAAVADADGLLQALLDGGNRAALQAALDALDAGASPEALMEVVSLAAIHRFLRFDPAVDLNPGVQDNWLSVTHGQTFCHAVRRALATSWHPDLMRAVLQAVRMVSMTRPLDAPEAERVQLVAGSGSPGSVTAAVQARDPQAAVSAVLGCEVATLWEPLRALAFADPVVRPIFAAHVLKQTLVAFDDAEALGTSLPIAALVRFLASPRQERNVARLVSEAIGLVRDGAVPRVLVDG